MRMIYKVFTCTFLAMFFASVSLFSGNSSSFSVAFASQNSDFSREKKDTNKTSVMDSAMLVAFQMASGDGYNLDIPNTEIRDDVKIIQRNSFEEQEEDNRQYAYWLLDYADFLHKDCHDDASAKEYKEMASDIFKKIIKNRMEYKKGFSNDTTI